ncbi:MAG TPA: RsmG family class I SAM-dependent methyltransferase [Ilumatobacteraceae bacterium]|nr:RsmG family class I SAM-dependent methyltransferase [Ilumatobacteraceae bacterium]
MRGETAPELTAVLEDAQRLGFLGSRPIPEVVEHARGFVRAIEHRASHGSVLDLGSGGGVPGLVIAHDLPATHVTLLDRRAKRTDALERFVRRLGWQERVSVVCADVSNFVQDASFDAVVARGFGPPAFTLSAAARLVRPGQVIVISEPPDGNRWEEELLQRLGLRQIQRADDTTGDRAAPSSLDGLVAVFLKD